MMISPRGLLLFFVFFILFFLGAVSGIKGQKQPKMKIQITSVTHHFSGTVLHMISFVKYDVSRRFCHFFKTLIFQVFSGCEWGKKPHIFICGTHV